jgi:SAM-dependent methyltransferase
MPSSAAVAPFPTGEKIHAVFDVHNFTLCNSSQIRGTDPLRVLTPRQQWSYAVMIPLNIAALEEVTGPVTVSVEATVHSGKIGIGFVAEDGNTYLSEVEHTFIAEKNFDLSIKSLASGRWLIVRNTAPGGVASEVTLHAVRVFRMAGAPSRSGLIKAADEVVVSERWGVAPDDELNWATIPMMQRHAADFNNVLKQYIHPAAHFDRVLSLCCGHGQFEQTVLQLLSYDHCDALDISESALENARRLAREAGIAGVSYECQDINRLSLAHHYDLVFAAGVHHLSNLEHVFDELTRWIRPDAPFMLYEYIGPNQCQPSARQVEAINACIRLLPEKYRLRVSAQREMDLPGADEALQVLRRKRAEVRGESAGAAGSGLISSDPLFAGFFWQEYVPMTTKQWDALDPSESVRSQDIIPVLKRYFSEVDVRYQGGSIIQFTLHDLAANFYGESEEVRELLQMLLKIEDVLTTHDPEIPRNYAIIVARNPISR